MIIGLTGYARAGKDYVADFLVQNYNFQKYVFSDILSEILKELNLENSKENQSKLGVALRKVSTQHILASMLCDKLKNKENVVVSGFRSPGEVKLFRDTFGQDFSLIYLNRTFENRYRYRRDPMLSDFDFKKRDERDGREMGLNELIETQLFDFSIENNDSDYLLFQKVSGYIEEIKAKCLIRLAHEGRMIVKNNCDFINWIDAFQREHGFDKHKKEHFYLVQAWANTRIATCLRRRHGAVIVSQKDMIIGSGYNGAQRGIIDSLERKMCFRDMMEIPKGTRYEACVSSHAEENAIDFTYDRHGLEGATIYIVGVDNNGNIYDTLPCIGCAKKIAQIGIKKIVCATRPETDKKLFKVLTREELIHQLETGEYFPHDIKTHPEFKTYQDNVVNIRNTWEKYKKEE